METSNIVDQQANTSDDFEQLHVGTEKNNLSKTLDDKLERYLETLDEYEKAMKDVSKLLASGYISLAEANFHNRSSAIRYGQDCYDERMQAIRKVYVHEGVLGTKNYRPIISISTEEKEKSFSTPVTTIPRTQQDIEGQDKPIKPTVVPEGNPTSNTFPEETPEASDQSTQDTDEAKESSEQTPSKSNDPLRWFGILVPPALRTAQSTFVEMLEGPIAQLAVVTKDLKTQEIDIGRVRKQLKKL